MTKIMPCKCLHDFQDRRYCPGRRVHNRTFKAAAPLVSWRCTVCRDEKRDG